MKHDEFAYVHRSLLYILLDSYGQIKEQSKLILQFGMSSQKVFRRRYFLPESVWKLLPKMNLHIILIQSCRYCISDMTENDLCNVIWKSKFYNLINCIQYLRFQYNSSLWAFQTFTKQINKRKVRKRYMLSMIRPVQQKISKFA